jgi:hypothetical protein
MNVVTKTQRSQTSDATHTQAAQTVLETHVQTSHIVVVTQDQARQTHVETQVQRRQTIASGPQLEQVDVHSSSHRSQRCSLWVCHASQR